MKTLTVGLTVLTSASALFATDYFYSDPNWDNSSTHKRIIDAQWYEIGTDAASDPIAPSTDTAADSFWIVNGSGYASGGHAATIGNFDNEGANKEGGTCHFDGRGTLNLGAPANHPTFPGAAGELRHRRNKSAFLYLTRMNWYNGTLNNLQQYATRFFGEVYVHNDPGSSHAITMNDKNRALELRCSLVSDSPDVQITMRNDGLDSMDRGAYIKLLDSGDGSDATHGTRYKGTFALLSPYLHFYFGRNNPLGDPNTPQAAALSVCDKGSFGVHIDGEQSANRGIRLEGATAYYSTYADGCTLKYPVSRADGVAGKLIKYDAYTVTFDNAYTAGDLEVQKGKLILGWNFTAPAGTNIKVCDGAELVSYVDLAPFNVTTEGSGKSGYAEGYRYVDGVLQFKVTVSVSGDGTVSANELWANATTPASVTATATADEFLNWSGDVGFLQKGCSPFAATATVTPMAPGSIVANFGTVTTPENVTLDDGTTLVYANRALTITVPQDVSSTYDYSSAVISSLITNIVKSGEGEFQPPAMPNYVGDFDIREGAWITSASAEFGAEDVGILRFASGTTNYINTTVAVARGKKVYCGGTFQGRVAKASENGYLVACDVVFTDTVYQNQNGNAFFLFKASKVDLAGHPLVLSSTGTYQEFNFDGIAFTNSSSTAVTLSVPTKYHRLYLLNGTSFKGGPQNVLNYSWDTRTHFATMVDSDWTLNLNTLYHCNGAKATSNMTNFQWTGAVNVGYYSSNGEYQNRFVNCDGNDNCLTFGGPVFGDKMLKVQGGALNFTGRGSTYSGQIWMRHEKVQSLQPIVKVWDGAEFSHSATLPVLLESADFEIGTSTFYALPAIELQTGTGAFRGGAAADKPCGRSTVKAYTSTATLLTFDSPAIVTGTTAINAGTLALGAAPKTADELPVFSNLVFAADTVFDMKGNDLTVPNLTGFPTVQNAGTLTIAGTWTVEHADVIAGKLLDLGTGSLTFAPGTLIRIVNRSVAMVPSDITLARAAAIVGNPAVAGWKRNVEIRGGDLVLVQPGCMMLIR